MTYWRGMYCASWHLQWDDNTKKLLYFTPRNHFLINSSHLAVGARTQCACRRPKAKSSRLHITYLVEEGVTTKYISFPYKCSRKTKICPRYGQDMPKICPRYAQNIPKIWPRNAWDTICCWDKMSPNHIFSVPKESQNWFSNTAPMYLKATTFINWEMK